MLSLSLLCTVAAGTGLFTPQMDRRQATPDRRASFRGGRRFDDLEPGSREAAAAGADDAAAATQH